VLIDSERIVAEDADPDSLLSKADKVKAGSVSIPHAEEDQGSNAEFTLLSSDKLLPPSTDSLVAAKAAIAGEERESYISRLLSRLRNSETLNCIYW
jgi:hypothetical protein